MRLHEALYKNLKKNMNEDSLWSAIISLADTMIYTSGRGKASGRPFTYAIHGDEMFISTKAKSITKATVMIACRKAVEIQNSEGCISGLKRIGTFGASYLYPVFLKLGIITRRPTYDQTDLLSWVPAIGGDDIVVSEIKLLIESLTLSENDNIMDSQDNAKELTIMTRPKGSKNKKTTVVIETVENIDERIVATESAISTLTEELKAKKMELKELTKAKAEAEKLAAEKKAEEDKTKLLDAIAASGKSIDEVIEMISQ